MHREVAGTDTNDRKLLHKAFPNLTYDDFYYEIWRKKESSVIAICRKQYVEDLTVTVSNKVTVAGISLGVMALSAITPLFSASAISTNSFNVFLYDKENSIEVNENIPEKVYNINGLELKNSSVLSFGGVLGLFISTANTGNILQYNLSAKDAFLQKSFFNKGLKAGITTLLILLLVNFFVFSHYYDKANASAEKVALNTADTKILTALKTRVKEKEQKATQIINESSLKSSGLLNQIASAVPASVLLSEINYHPLQKKLKQDEALEVADNIIEISGNTANGNEFTQWVEHIEYFDWVAGVTILSYGKTESSTGFSIRINSK